MSDPRAIEAARRGYAALVRGENRDAAWLGLWATELDPEQGLGWALLARILHAVSGDALATLVTEAALELPMPTSDRAKVARYLRIDLWSRGLVVHDGRATVLRATDFDHPDRFRPLPELERWRRERLESWGDRDRAKRAVARLVAALSDGWEMPGAGDPLRTDAAWAPMPEYAAWRDRDPLAEPEPEAEPEPDPTEMFVVSDAWTEVRIGELERGGELEAALALAERWAELRANRIRPLVAVLRLAAGLGRTDQAAAIEAELLGIETEDLSELEAARVGLGLLGRFPAQLEVLERMNRLAPGHPVILANRGAVRLELGEQAEAEADLRLALELDPTNGPAMTNLALIRLREDDYVAARALLEEAKRLHPDEAQVRYYLAACLQNQRHPEAALREAQAARELDPEFEPAKRLLDELSRPG